MEMTKTEIIRKYKQQESKAQQKRSIEEMAQLNGCSRAEIACILLEENLAIPATKKYYEGQIESDMRRRAEEASGASKKTEKVAPTRCQSGKSVDVWQQSDEKNTQGGTNNAEKVAEMADKQVNVSADPTEDKPKMPQSVIDALIGRIEALEDEMSSITQEQKSLAEQMKQKEAEYLEICGFMGIGPQAAGA